MRAMTRHPKAIIRPLLAATVLLLGLAAAPAQASGSEVIAVATFGGPVNVFYWGEFAEDGSIQGSYVVGPYFGPFEGWFEEDGTLVLQFTRTWDRTNPDAIVLLIFNRVWIDLATGYAENDNGGTSAAHVVIRE